MIEHSFIFLDRINEKSEKNIWKQGIFTWDDFRDAERIKRMSKERQHYHSRRLNEAERHIIADNAAYFATKMPKSEVWRLYEHFKDHCIFLDIETSGTYADITVIGISDGEQHISLVKGFNLDREHLEKALAGKKMLVTFNGQSFDSPVINRYFGGIIKDMLHFDLRFPLKKLGYEGGLKQIEENLGIERDDEVKGVDSVELWKEYLLTKDDNILKLLLSYNEYDVRNLEPLSEFVFSSMKKEMKKNLA